MKNMEKAGKLSKNMNILTARSMVDDNRRFSISGNLLASRNSSQMINYSKKLILSF